MTNSASRLYAPPLRLWSKYRIHLRSNFGSRAGGQQCMDCPNKPGRSRFRVSADTLTTKPKTKQHENRRDREK